MTICLFRNDDDCIFIKKERKTRFGARLSAWVKINENQDADILPNLSQHTSLEIVYDVDLLYIHCDAHCYTVYASTCNKVYIPVTISILVFNMSLISLN